MKLWVKLGLVYSLIVAVIFAAVGLSTYRLVRQRFEMEYDLQLKHLFANMDFQLKRKGRNLASRLRELAESEKVMGVAARAAAGTLEPQVAVSAAEPWLKSSDFDFLTLIDEQSNILSCGHWPARYGYPDKASFITAQKPLVPTILSVDSPNGRQLAYLAAAEVKLGDTRLFLVGGYYIDHDFLAEIRGYSTAIAVLLGRDIPRVYVMNAMTWSSNEFEMFLDLVQKSGLSSDQVRVEIEGHPFRVRELVLKDRDQKPAASLLVLFTEEELARSLTALSRSFIILTALGVLLALIIVWFIVSRLIGKPLAELSAAAQDVAGGQLNILLPVKTSDEIGKLVQAFNKMTQDLRQSQERLRQAERIAAWKEIARRIAHEIKNPLMPIQLAMQTLKKAYQSGRRDFPEILSESTSTVLEEVERLKRIVDEFREFSRLPAANLAPADLNEVVLEGLKLFSGLPESIRLKTELAPGLPGIMLDREQMHRVLINLVNNAVAALPRGGEIVIRTGYKEEKYVIMEAQDNGEGMSEEVLENIFTPYYTTHESGTGLGLSIVHRIITDHGGTVSVVSKPGTGTTFTIIFPAI